jgi:S-DNA-T family DNA segregation ATPase FtsK/SpoIIIE
MNPQMGPWHHVTCDPEGGPSAIELGIKRASGGETPILLVDDADRLPAIVSQKLSSALQAGAAVIATADIRPGLFARCPFALQGNGASTGIVLAPQSPGDGDAFGVRLEPLGRIPPGRAVAILEGEPVEVQLGKPE